jgi:hypothetical protein
MFDALLSPDPRLSANQRRKKSNAIMATALERLERKGALSRLKDGHCTAGAGTAGCCDRAVPNAESTPPGLAGLAPVPHARKLARAQCTSTIIPTSSSYNCNRHQKLGSDGCGWVPADSNKIGTSKDRASVSLLSNTPGTCVKITAAFPYLLCEPFHTDRDRFWSI